MVAVPLDTTVGVLNFVEFSVMVSRCGDGGADEVEVGFRMAIGNRTGDRVVGLHRTRGETEIFRAVIARAA